MPNLVKETLECLLLTSYHPVFNHPVFKSLFKSVFKSVFTVGHTFEYLATDPGCEPATRREMERVLDVSVGLRRYLQHVGIERQQRDILANTT